MQDYMLFKLDRMDSNIKLSFEDLPEDNYIKDTKKYRKRRYSIGYTESSRFYWNSNDNGEYQQSITYNSYMEGVKRTYAPLNDKVKDSVKNEIIPEMLTYLPKLNYKTQIHQIRIVADNESIGIPVPEGVHQDGYDYIFILSVANHNVAGGNSIILESLDSHNILFEHILQPRECLFVNDKKLFHYASPIVPKLPGKCYRDIMVITFENENSFK